MAQKIELKGKSFLTLKDFSKEEIKYFLSLASYLKTKKKIGIKDNLLEGKKESMEDTAIVLGRFFDGIEFRGYKQETVECLSKYSGVPVWNGLTDEYHPTQILADLLTVSEHVDKPFDKIKFVYIGDAYDRMRKNGYEICFTCTKRIVAK